jgi:AcrR family transcriptional regulator
VGGARHERADAVRNRAAILHATEQLLAEEGPERLTLDRVAARAGVGKGTVFRRFGSRTGLFQELLAEQAVRILAAIDGDRPPLGRDAHPQQRLLAFLDELVDLACRNIALIAAHEQACANDRLADPTYQRWHEHLRGLLTRLAPHHDADFLAHMLLSCFDGELVRHVLAHGGRARLRANVRALATAVLTTQPDVSKATVGRRPRGSGVGQAST